MHGLVKSTGESGEDNELVLYLRYSSARVESVGIGNAYPVRLSLQLSETGNALHEIGRVLIPIFNDGNTLRT